MDRVGELHIVEEAACWERKFMLFKVYLRQSVGMSSRPKPSKSVRPYWGVVINGVNNVKGPAYV